MGSIAPKLYSKPGAGRCGVPTTFPKPIILPTPDYPADARQRQVGGIVTLRFTVDVQGAVRDVRVVNATPAGVFDQAAVAAVQKARYEPGLADGKPAETSVQLELHFVPEPVRPPPLSGKQGRSGPPASVPGLGFNHLLDDLERQLQQP